MCVCVCPPTFFRVIKVGVGRIMGLREHEKKSGGLLDELKTGKR